MLDKLKPRNSRCRWPPTKVYAQDTVLLKQKKWPVLDITGFFFRMSTGKFFCFNNNVSNLYNNSVVVKIIGMAYIFTLLMFRKRYQLTKIKRHIFIGQRPFDSRLYLDIQIFQGLSSEKNRLYLDISRSFKCLKSSPVVCLICYYLRLVIFILREYILKVHILVSSEHKLFQI